MSLIILDNVTARLDDHVDLRDVYFRVATGARVGLIGKNHASKTTLLRLILGELNPARGTVTVERGARIGYFSQCSELTGDETVEEALEGVFSGVRMLEPELRAVEERLATLAKESEEHRASLLDRHAALSAEFERLGGWTYQNEIDTMLSRLGFDEALRRRPAAGATAPASPGCSSSGRTCCCSTSQRTTSTSRG